MTHDISDEQNKNHFNNHALTIVKWLKDGAKELLGKELSVEYNAEEPYIRIDNGMIDIFPGIHEQKRIGKIAYSCAFDIFNYIHHPQTRMEPEDLEDQLIETVRGPVNVAEKALLEWFKLNSSGWFNAAWEASEYNIEQEQI